MVYTFGFDAEHNALLPLVQFMGDWKHAYDRVLPVCPPHLTMLLTRETATLRGRGAEHQTRTGDLHQKVALYQLS